MQDREKLRKNNLEMFKTRHPAHYQMLMKFEPRTELVFDEDGNPDVSFDGQLFYSNDAQKFAEDQLEEFWENPLRVYLSPPEPDILDDYAGKSISNMLAYGVEQELTYQHTPLDADAFTVIIMGVGLGFHIDEIIEKTNCRAVTIVDINEEFLYHSLDVYDWVKLDEVITSREGWLRFAIDKSPKILSDYMRLFVRGSNTAGLDGLTVYQHQNNPIFEQARATFFQEINLIMTSLGFFYDETLMLKNCHANFYGGESKYYKRPSEALPGDFPVFVVGSGPSLDACLPIIKANSDRAFIISAGTSLRPLVVNGITPDMHLEQENLNVNLTVSQVAADHDLSKVLYIAASTVEPKATRHFDRVIYYSRISLSPYPIYFNDKETCLEHPHNTVVNASFSFVQELGFKEFYFFGVDCGTVDATRHHSKDAYQYTEGALHVDQEFKFPVTSNFGGDFLTSFGLQESLDHLVEAISLKSRGRSYINCSDGAYISGTLPLLPEKVDLPKNPKGKEEIKDKIFEEMPTFTQEKFDERWDEESFRDYVVEICDRLIDIVEDVEDFSDTTYQIKLNQILLYEDFQNDSDSDMERGVVVLLRGSVFQIMFAFDYYYKRIIETDKKEAFGDFFRDEFASMMDRLRAEAFKELGNLNEEYTVANTVDA
jgi:hypothetical protein